LKTCGTRESETALCGPRLKRRAVNSFELENVAWQRKNVTMRNIT